MDKELMKRQLANVLPDYELVPDSSEELAADETAPAEANAGPLRGWRKMQVRAMVERPSVPDTAELKSRFRKREL